MMVHESVICELEKSGGHCDLFGKPPLFCIKSEDYNGERILNQFGEDSGWKILKGSKIARQRLYSDYAPKYQYLYHFAEWLGRRFARSIDAGGARVARIDCKKGSLHLGHHAIEKCFEDSFRVGFCMQLEIAEPSHRRSFPVGLTQTKRYQGGRFVNSALYLYFLDGIEDEKRRTIFDLISESANLDEMQSVMV